jgi:RNA polymerase sigma-70 factor (ECF subfamily)
MEDFAHPPKKGFVQTLADERDRFLRFLETRVEDAATAEDILQTAYMKAVQHGSDIREGESVVAWFYRILRNSVVDHYRRRAAWSKVQDAFAAETPKSYELRIQNAACECVRGVVRDLKPEYRSAVESVDLLGTSVVDFAGAEQISVNNASVRLHRARKAVAKQLKAVCGFCAEHKCVDCTCRHESGVRFSGLARQQL